MSVMASATGDWCGNNVVVDGIGKSAFPDALLDTGCDISFGLVANISNAFCK
jgi:hypothetical protein